MFWFVCLFVHLFFVSLMYRVPPREPRWVEEKKYFPPLYLFHGRQHGRVNKEIPLAGEKLQSCVTKSQNNIVMFATLFWLECGKHRSAVT